MRISIEGAPEEIAARGHTALEALAGQLRAGGAPELADVLEKAAHALDPPSVELDTPALRELHRRARRRYADEIAGMIDEIAEVLGLPRRDLKRSVLADWAPDEALEKAVGHKYLARIPTGNPKRPWRYVYKLRGGEYRPASSDVGVVRKKEHELKIGAKFADGQKGGHWELKEIEHQPAPEGRPSFEGKHLHVFVHDETGERHVVNGRYQVAEWVSKLHETEVTQERDRRRERATAAAHAAVGVLRERRATFDAEPSADNLARYATQWKRITDHASNANWRDADWRRALGVSEEVPKSLKALRDEFEELAIDLRAAFPDADDFENNATDSPFTAEKVLRWKFLRGLFHDPEKTLTERWGLPDRGPRKLRTVNLHSVLERLGDAEPTPRNLLKAAGQALWLMSYEKAADLKNVVILADPVRTYDSDVLKNPERWAAVRAWADKRGWWFAGAIHYDRDGSYTGKHARQTIGGGASRLSDSMGPEVYASADPQARRPTRADIAAEIDRGLATEEEKRHGREVALLPNANPVISVSVLAKSAEPKKGSDWEKTAWQANGRRSRRYVTLPLNTYLDVMEHERGKRLGGLVKAHREKLEKMRRGANEMAAKVGPIADHTEAVLSDVVAGMGLEAPVAAEVRRKMLDGMALQNTMRINGLPRRLQDAAREAHNHLHPEREKLALEGWRSDASPEAKAASAERDRFMDEIAGKMARGLLERIVKAAGHTPAGDEHGRARVSKLSDDELAFIAEGRARAGAAPQVLTSYTPDGADGKQMRALFGVVAKDVVPHVGVIVHDKYIRAHCGYDNTIELAPGDQPWVMWHEYGHAIEHASPGIGDAARALLAARAGAAGRPVAGLGAGYEPHEIAYEDHWWSEYVGKWYGEGGSTEVLSMGLQELMHDPVAFHERDAEHFWFTVAAVSGRYGKAERDPQAETIARRREKMASEKLAKVIKQQQQAKGGA